MNRDFITMIPKQKSDCKCGCHKEGHRPTKVRRNRSSGKRMVAIFIMKSGLVESIPLESGASVNADRYVNNCLSQVFDVVPQRRDKTGLRGLILHDDNAQPHRASTTNEFLVQNRVESYQNPPYSPNMSPCDFFLFGKLKSQLRGIRFNDDNDMLSALDSAIRYLTKEDFQNYFSDWFSRRHKCIDARGEYFEKIN